MILTDEDVSRLYTEWAKTPGSSYADLAWSVESAVLRKLRERPADAWLSNCVSGRLVTAEEGEHAVWESAGLQASKLHIIPGEEE